MALDGFFGGDAAEFVSQGAGAFGGVGGPHLLEAIGEAGFENAAGDGGEWAVEAEVGFLPDLFFLAFEGPKGFGFLC